QGDAGQGGDPGHALLDEHPVVRPHVVREEGGEHENLHPRRKRRPQLSSTSSDQSSGEKSLAPLWWRSHHVRIGATSKISPTKASRANMRSSNSGRSSPRSQRASGTENPILGRFIVSSGRRFRSARFKMYFCVDPRSL